MPRREISLSRSVPPILSYRRRLRTFHHSRVRFTATGRPMMTLDQVVTVSVPLLRSVHPHFKPHRTIQL